jgi:dienelactone hydrolase
MVLPSGVTRLAGTDTIDRAGLRGTVSVLPIRGPSDQQAHQVRVWRPPGPDSAAIPVLYFLPGDPGWARDPFANGLARTLNRLLREGNPPFVFASVDGNGERHQDTEWANSRDGSELVMDRVTGAAIAAVEGTHVRDAAHRAIAGFSTGGYGTMNIAPRNREVFGQVVPVAVRVQPGAHNWADAMTALRQAFAFLTSGWRQAAADDAADSGFWAAAADSLR